MIDCPNAPPPGRGPEKASRPRQSASVFVTLPLPGRRREVLEGGGGMMTAAAGPFPNLYSASPTHAKPSAPRLGRAKKNAPPTRPVLFFAVSLFRLLTKPLFFDHHEQGQPRPAETPCAQPLLPPPFAPLVFDRAGAPPASRRPVRHCICEFHTTQKPARQTS